MALRGVKVLELAGKKLGFFFKKKRIKFSIRMISNLL